MLRVEFASNFILEVARAQIVRGSSGSGPRKLGFRAQNYVFYIKNHVCANFEYQASSGF